MPGSGFLPTCFQTIYLHSCQKKKRISQKCSFIKFIVFFVDVVCEEFSKDELFFQILRTSMALSDRSIKKRFGRRRLCFSCSSCSLLFGFHEFNSEFSFCWFWCDFVNTFFSKFFKCWFFQGVCYTTVCKTFSRLILVHFGIP